MKEQPSNPCEKVSFILTYDQLEAAYNIYREQFISCDFIRRSMERLEMVKWGKILHTISRHF